MSSSTVSIPALWPIIQGIARYVIILGVGVGRVITTGAKPVWRLAKWGMKSKWTWRTIGGLAYLSIIIPYKIWLELLYAGVPRVWGVLGGILGVVRKFDADTWSTLDLIFTKSSPSEAIARTEAFIGRSLKSGETASSAMLEHLQETRSKIQQRIDMLASSKEFRALEKKSDQEIDFYVREILKEKPELEKQANEYISSRMTQEIRDMVPEGDEVIVDGKKRSLTEAVKELLKNQERVKGGYILGADLMERALTDTELEHPDMPTKLRKQLDRQLWQLHEQEGRIRER